MRTHHITPAEEELILSIVTHPRLHPSCWVIIDQSQPLDNALLGTLQTLFPSEIKICRTAAWRKKQNFWRVVADFVERGLFQTLSVFNTPLPSKQTQASETEYNPSGGSLYDTYAGIHMPGEAYDYLLMSGTS